MTSIRVIYMSTGSMPVATALPSLSINSPGAGEDTFGVPLPSMTENVMMARSYGDPVQVSSAAKVKSPMTMSCQASGLGSSSSGSPIISVPLLLDAP